MGKRKSRPPKTEKKISSGYRKCAKTKKILRRLNMKIKRFKRYLDEGHFSTKHSKRKGWSVEGMLRHKSLLEQIIKRHCKKTY